MSSKKDFTAANTGRVYSAIQEATAAPEAQQAQEAKKERKTYSQEEEQQFMEAGSTQGRKGLKAKRINMAFSPSVHEYITVMARVRGETISQFTEHVFRQHMEENAALYEQAKQFKNSF